MTPSRFEATARRMSETINVAKSMASINLRSICGIDSTPCTELPTAILKSVSETSTSFLDSRQLFQASAPYYTSLGSNNWWLMFDPV